MRDAFIDFLATQATLPEGMGPRLRSMVRGVPEPIGSIAFKYGLVSTEDIDTILDEQREDHRPFGVIATERGILTKRQLDALLKVQQIRYAVEVAEALSLSGQVEVNEIMTHLGEFLTSNASVPTA